MQDPNADTEWNDILRKKGILPSKKDLKDLEKEAEEEEQRILQQSIGELTYVCDSVYLCLGNTWQASNCFSRRIL